jgi:hypothetical protein
MFPAPSCFGCIPGIHNHRAAETDPDIGRLLFFALPKIGHFQMPERFFIVPFIPKTHNSFRDT